MAENHTHGESQKIASPPGFLLSWGRLARISNLPTAVSNILVGYLIANHGWTPIAPLMILIFASALLYSAGMILNDVFDVNVDQKERPERPIPSGAISLPTARMVGLTMLLLGALIPLLVSIQAGIVAILLAIAVILYDKVLKHLVIAPIAMGLCRTLNILLGSTTLISEHQTAAFVEFPALAVWYAASIGVLIAGTTWFARNESTTEVDGIKRSKLIVAATIVVIGLVGIATSNYQWTGPGQNRIAELLPFLIILISITILRRLFTACVTCHSGDVQAAVISILRSLIIFDAAICLFVAPSQSFHALAVLSLLIPCLLLARWIKQT